jgi:iron-sulfur cluster assembly 2
MLRSVVSTLLVRQRRLLVPAVVWRKNAASTTRPHHIQNIPCAETFAISGNRCITCRSMVVVTNTRSTELNHASPSSASAPILANAATSALPTSSISSDQSVFVTDSCWRRIRQLLAAKQESLPSSSNTLYLRVFVDAGGCSGFTYQFELDHDDNLDETEDIVFRQPNVDGATTTTVTTASPRVVVDRTSLQYIAGSKIDYVQEMIKSSFEVRDNPQSESACGCGSSFALKNFASNPAMD